MFGSVVWPIEKFSGYEVVPIAENCCKKIVHGLADDHALVCEMLGRFGHSDFDDNGPRHTPTRR